MLWIIFSIIYIISIVIVYKWIQKNNEDLIKQKGLHLYLNFLPILNTFTAITCLWDMFDIEKFYRIKNNKENNNE